MVWKCTEVQTHTNTHYLSASNDLHRALFCISCRKVCLRVALGRCDAPHSCATSLRWLTTNLFTFVSPHVISGCVFLPLSPFNRYAVRHIDFACHSPQKLIAKWINFHRKTELSTIKSNQKLVPNRTEKRQKITSNTFWTRPKKKKNEMKQNRSANRRQAENEKKNRWNERPRIGVTLLSRFACETKVALNFSRTTIHWNFVFVNRFDEWNCCMMKNTFHL